MKSMRFASPARWALAVRISQSTLPPTISSHSQHFSNKPHYYTYKCLIEESDTEDQFYPKTVADCLIRKGLWTKVTVHIQFIMFGGKELSSGNNITLLFAHIYYSHSLQSCGEIKAFMLVTHIKPQWNKFEIAHIIKYSLINTKWFVTHE